MYILGLVIVLALLVWASFHVLRRSNPRRQKLPPGPYPFPIIGNILQLDQNPHQSIANCSKIYGTLMSLHLGSLYTVVVSSPQAAKQVLQQHDKAFSSRHVQSAFEAHNFHKKSFGLLPVANRKWKNARKICREHLFSTLRLDESKGVRLDNMTKLRDYIHEFSVRGGAVNIGDAVFTSAINLMTVTLLSVELTTFRSDSAHNLKETVEALAITTGSPNLADFFPLLKPIDPQGIRRRAEFYLGKMIDLFGDIIDHRAQSRGTSIDSPNKCDLLETLLNLREQSNADLSISDINNLFVDLFLGHSHTTTSTVEWAMTELILNPTKMAKTKNELMNVVGKNKQVEELDISRLPYLQAVIKETLRIHPAAPFLIPRKADYEVEINGYTIPIETQILINVWGMGRDSSIWPNPTSFEPERFLNTKIGYKAGQDFMFVPFGSGRRICPGISLVDRVLPLMVASLIHEFDWKLEVGVKPEDVDTTEKFGLALRKAVPLVAIPIKVNVN